MTNVCLSVCSCLADRLICLTAFDDHSSTDCDYWVFVIFVAVKFAVLSSLMFRWKTRVIAMKVNWYKSFKTMTTFTEQYNPTDYEKPYKYWNVFKTLLPGRFFCKNVGEQA